MTVHRSIFAGWNAQARVWSVGGGLWVGLWAGVVGGGGSGNSGGQDKSRDVRLGRSGFAERDFNGLATALARCAYAARGVAEVNYGGFLGFSHLGRLP